MRTLEYTADATSFTRDRVYVVKLLSILCAALITITTKPLSSLHLSQEHAHKKKENLKYFVQKFCHVVHLIAKQKYNKQKFTSSNFIQTKLFRSIWIQHVNRFNLWK